MQLMEKHWEIQKELHMVFLDLEKAYYMVPPKTFGGVCGSRVCLKKCVQILNDTYEDAMT